MAHLVPIEDAAHRALHPYTAIRERDLVTRDALFVAEGEVVLRVLAFRSKLVVRSLLLERRRVDAVSDVLAALPEEVPAYVVPQELMNGVVGFAIHRGVLALGERGPALSPAQLVKGASVLVGLVGLTNHDNVGGIFRNAAAFGASGVLLDAASCDPLYRKAIRVSSGATLSLPFAHGGTGEELIALLRASGIECWAMTPSGAESLAGLSPPQRLALVLGPEGPGLPENVMQDCRRVAIPVAGGMDSLNVATAGAIALAHVAARRAG